MKIDKAPIQFRQLGKLVNYNVGDEILSKHEQVINFYYSGQVEEKEMFNIKYATINISSGGLVNNPLEEIKTSLEEAKTAIKELSNSVSQISKPNLIESKEPIKKDDIKLIINEIVVPKENIESEGTFGESITEGTDIKYKVKKLKRVMENKDE
jgi:hypothetical protein